ncbi:DUF2066 domain-containing protein [Alkalimonas collagenimarina]|uniref:DUF2066 domain-containing protein n=1 Tax=Alkalimonas collagenimarina TaxID=400390 RepID=A0ABT9H073_9GAMM|nr:DUF2066 domain-containing protein [Alkalimonas collagenimarina]MDP4536716.1 DUF2066 domain-containing protein [Alkalimonas collagenimarina]
MPDLYTAEVPADQSRQAWQRQALMQVVERIAGDPEVMAHPALQQELQRANTYIKQFEAIRNEQGSALRVMVDQQKLEQFFRQHQLPVWGSRRPQVLVWLVEQTPDGRQFISQSDHEVIRHIRTLANQRGVPLIWPLYDMDDLVNLSETDVWAGFWQQIRQASARYQPDLIAAVMLSSSTEAETEIQQLYWQLDQQQRVLRFEHSQPEQSAVLRDFVSQLADQLAANYSVSYVDESVPVQLRIGGVQQWSDWVVLQRLLESFPGVTQVDLMHRSAEYVDTQLVLSITQTGFLQLLALEPQLRLADSVAPMQSYSLIEQQPDVAERFYVQFEPR